MDSATHPAGGTRARDAPNRDAHAALVEKQRNLLQMSETMSGVGAWRHDIKTAISTWSDVVYAVYGVDRASFDLSYASIMACFVDEDRPIAAAEFGAAVREGRSCDYKVRVRRRDGEVRRVHTRGACEFDLLGQVVAIYGVTQDITERERTLEELQSARDAAERAAQAKEDFLANMSHELRTPLNSIVGFSSLVATAPELSDETRRRAELISVASRSLVTMVDEILDFSRMQAQGVRLEPSPEHIEDIVTSAIALVGDEAGRRGVALTLETLDVFGPVLIDGARVRQVVLNLLSNAIKFTPPGGRVCTRIRATVDGAMKIEVQDTGVGVSPDRLDGIFDRFAQADSTTSRRYGGAGLGLTICRTILDAMEGRIGVESAVGVGSTFWFTLRPAAAPNVCGAAEPAVAPRDAIDVEGRRVLLVDDNDVNRDLFRALLAPYGLQIVEASDGSEAVAAVEALGFDIVLMDLQMPVMDGLEATRAIRARGRRDLPIVALTANVMPSQIDLCRRAGMNDHLGKPFVVADVVATIARWTEAR